MRIVFWLDPKVGFDWSTPEILSNIADGLVQMGYEVELLVENQILDDYRVKGATKRAWFAGANQQILADVLISNRLDYLLRDDYHRAGEVIWLALEEDLTAALNQFENYQLYDQIQVCTFHKEIKATLEQAQIETSLITPGIDLERLQVESDQKHLTPGLVIGLYDSRPEVVNSILKGVEMTQSAIPRLDIQILTDQEVSLESSLPLRHKVKPTLDERIQAYEKSDILVYVPGAERTALMPLEAMSKKVPVITSQHDAIQSFARHKKNCLVLDQVNPRTVALAILNIFKMGQIREDLKANGYQATQSYDLQLSIINFERLWSRNNQRPQKKSYLDSPEPDGTGIDLVLVNRNSGAELAERISAIRTYTPEPYRLIVVDNGSQDESIDYLKQAEGISLIVNQQNTGFAKACNQGIMAGKGDHIVLLHSDIQVTEGWLEPLLKTARRPKVGLVTLHLQVAQEEVETKGIEKVSAEGVTDQADLDVLAGNLSEAAGEGEPDFELGFSTSEESNTDKNQSDEDGASEADQPKEARRVPKVEPNSDSALTDPDEDPFFFDGGCVVIKRELLTQIGLLDEEYFLYNETADYALRVMEKGYKALRVSDSTVIHHRQVEKDEVDQENWQKAWAQSGVRFKRKWGDRLQTTPKRKVDGILLFGLHPWQRRTQRTEAMIDYFTRQGQKVVYIEPYCSVSVAEDIGQGQYLYIFQGSGTIYNNLTHPGRQVEMARDLKAQLADWEIQTPLTWLEAPWWEPLLKQIEHPLLVYTTPENFLSEGLENYQQLKEKFQQEEASLLKNADLILVSSEKGRRELADSYGEKVVYSPGGFYPTDLDRFLDGNYTMPDELTQLSGYKVGIIGNFNRYTPKKLLAHLVKKHPTVSFVFVGEITCNLDELREIPNLYFLGNKSWDHLLDCLYFFDLMLYPYNDKGLNSYLDPYMVNYYLAMGKPVVAYQHPELERFGPVVKQAGDDQEFIKLVSDAIQKLGDEKDTEKIRERIHQIRGFSWEERFDQLYDLIDAQVPMAYVRSRPAEETEVASVPEDQSKEAPMANLWRQIQDGYKRLFGGLKRDQRK